MSISCNGNLFTWKKKIRTYTIYEIVDRAIARIDWANIYPEALVTHGQFTCSDHCPILLATSNLSGRRKSFPFRFQNAWIQYRQPDTIVAKQWMNHVQGTKMFKISQKLNSTE